MIVVELSGRYSNGSQLRSNITGQSAQTPTPICNPDTPHPCPILSSTDAVLRAREQFAFEPTGITTRLVSSQTVYVNWLNSTIPEEMDPEMPMWVVALEGTNLLLFDVMPPVFVESQSAGSGLSNRPVVGAYAVFEAGGGMMLLHGVLEHLNSGDPTIDTRYSLMSIQSLSEEQITIATATPIIFQ